MKAPRFLTILGLAAAVLLVNAGTALANMGGQGFYGETDDKVITQTMFGVIAFFPLVIILFSLIQWQLDKRKHARVDAAKRRAASADWRGGW